MQTQSCSSARALFVLSLFTLAVGCTAAVGPDTAGDALHASLGTCPDGTVPGATCDALLAECATSTDFAVACRCETTAEGVAHIRCDEPLPVPPLRICADDAVAGGRCEGRAPEESACVLPRGGRCVCRGGGSDPSLPPGEIYTWACEVPPPGPAYCEARTGADCTGREGASCDTGPTTRCTCSGTPGGADGSTPGSAEGSMPGSADGRSVWTCSSDAGVPPCSSDTTCDAARTCTLDIGWLCTCVDDGSTGRAGRYECGPSSPPPAPPADYCPRDVSPDTTGRVACDAIGASCSLADSAGSMGGTCRCVGERDRDGYWECSTAPPPPPPPPPADYCPRDVSPDTTGRVACDAIGASCSLSVPGSTTEGRCFCVEDSMRDPSRPVGVWLCRP